ncbi:MAG TPA: tetratricopeptide repeat protein [Bryobacteraceae bacterium]|nr:tetratricopeptide repeat protein [Bryobacteraceae bacterium]
MTKPPPANKPAFRFWFSIYAFTAFIMAIAVAVFAWLASESRKEAGEGRTANARPLRGQPIPPERLQLLSQFEPPAYAAEPGRKQPPLFTQAMEKYTARDYAGAIRALRTVTSAQPNFLPAHFYLGVSLLLTNNRAAGIEQLEAVTRFKGSPYVEKARFYLAKALLGQGDRSGAQQQLDQVIAMQGNLETQARALLAQTQ